MTVVIPTKDRRAMLARTLHSVLAQRDVELRVVVVDDGGSDGTAVAVEGLGDPRVAVVRHEVPQGVSMARNAGIERSGSPWLAFVDDDDLWSPTKLRAQLDELAATPGTRWSCVGAVHIDHRCHISFGELPLVDNDVADRILASNRVPGGGSGTLVARDLAVAVGGFDPALSNLADWDFYIRLALAAPCAGVPDYHVGYFVHTQGMAHNVARSAAEYNYITVKYSRERAQRGVELMDEEWLRYLGWMARRGGHRAWAWRLHTQLLRRFPTRGTLRWLAASAVPARVRRAMSNRRRQVPDEHEARWADDTSSWLAPYARGWLEPEVVATGGQYRPLLSRRNADDARR